MKGLLQNTIIWTIKSVWTPYNVNSSHIVKHVGPWNRLLQTVKISTSIDWFAHVWYIWHL